MIKQSYHRNHRSKSKKRGSQSTRIIHVSIRPKSNNSRSVRLSDVLFDLILNNKYLRHHHRQILEIFIDSNLRL